MRLREIEDREKGGDSSTGLALSFVAMESICRIRLKPSPFGGF